MDYITFIKGDDSKRSDVDFDLVTVGEIDLPDSNGKGTAEFMLRFGDVPISMRMNKITDFFKDVQTLEVVFSKDPHKFYTGTISILLDMILGTGVRLKMDYTVTENEKEKSQDNSKWEKDEVASSEE